MPEMKNNFQGGKMNKDLDERLVPNSEYRDALNVEIATSNDSDMGTLQTLKGNTLLSALDPQENQGFVCIGSIADNKNDKLYFMVAGLNRDIIVEYDYKNSTFIPVCVDNHAGGSVRALNFNPDFLITGINIIDDLLFWTDNNSEPKRINISRGIQGSLNNFQAHTKLMVADLSLSAQPNSYVTVLDQNGSQTLIQEKHLTVIKKGPPTPPVLEMIDTTIGDIDSDGEQGGEEVKRQVSSITPAVIWDLDTLEFVAGIDITVKKDTDGDGSGPDFSVGDHVSVYKTADRSIGIRCKIDAILAVADFSVTILAGNSEIQDVLNDGSPEDLTIELERPDSIFQFKFPRFACRYKYEDGEYSAFSPFTQPAFLPGNFLYLPKEGYNLGMVNRLRKLVIKDFVHDRAIDDDVVSIDILYKDSNSPNIYSVKTIKRIDYNPAVWDEWNGVSASIGSNSTIDTGNKFGIDGWHNRTKGYLPITTEMIRAVLPANQLLRPWDNVPRKALAQEVIGNRLVYGNYLQNYNLKNLTSEDNYIKVNISVTPRSNKVGEIPPEEIHAGLMITKRYSPAKSIKSFRTYQIGVVYIDQYGRETPVFSEAGDNSSETSTYISGDLAPKANQLKVNLKNPAPDWATHFKFFIKETSNEYYNLAMDRWYNAEDGNIWISFPSAERNKVDEETFLILKKEHDTGMAVPSPTKYKIIAIENEAPRFIKVKNVSLGALQDYDHDPLSEDAPFGVDANGFPLKDGFRISVNQFAFEEAGWKTTLSDQDISQVYFRVRSLQGVSKYYRLKQVSFDGNINSAALTGPTGNYILLSGSQFGDDMSHTSPNNTYNDRLRNCVLEIVKKIPEDRAEFEGRFFVKILKDAALIKNLNLTPLVSDGLLTTNSMKVQYIDPKAAHAQGVSKQTKWDGFGNPATSTNPTPGYSISIDDKNKDLTFTPSGMAAKHCKGKSFWEFAANNTGRTLGLNMGSQNLQDPGSSGWFIDKVEAFRPFKESTTNIKKDRNKNRDPQTTGWANGIGNGMAVYSTYIGETKNHKKYLQAYTIDGYKWSGANYLNVGNKFKPDYDAIRDASVTNGGKVAPSQGINTALNIIHLSHAGLNLDAEPNSTTGPAWWNADWAFKQGNKHALDIVFIGKLLTPGCLWRWKEDPGSVLYVTKDTALIDVTTSAYSNDNRNVDKEDIDIDGSPRKGVFLYNYAIFSDYSLKVNHTYKLYARYCISGDVIDSSIINWFNPIYYDKMDWASRDIPNHSIKSLPCFPPMITWLPNNPLFGAALYGWGIAAGIANLKVSLNDHPSYKAADKHKGSNNEYGDWDAHYEFPTAIWDSHKSYNRRRRFVIHAETAQEFDDNDDPMGLGSVAPHFYLPTNDPSDEPHFDVNLNPLAVHSSGTGVTRPDGTQISTNAPGIRQDGMYTGYTDPHPYPFDDGTDLGLQDKDIIPTHKSWDASTAAVQSNAPGSVTWEIKEQFIADEENFSSTNPAIFETEPKEDVGLDIYHEVGQIYPVNLNDETIEQFVGAVHADIKRNSFVFSSTMTGWVITTLSTGSSDDIRVVGAYDNFVMLGADSSGTTVVLDNTLSPPMTTPANGDKLSFYRADGGVTTAEVGPNTYTNSNGTWYELIGMSGGIGTGNNVHNNSIVLPWFNCYSFGNGVESDRIRDDFNQVTIDNGPKASTTIEEPYLEERRTNGFIWSGLYNSTSGINDLNQFIQAEKITKDVNPTYGSIQRLHARDSDLVAFCEDRVLNIFANKDALYNADGNTNVIATDRVLGSIKPFVGEYGISLNPESLASDSYRLYFSDSSRGSILRLSQNGITPISDSGMHDWFADNLAHVGDNKIIGSFDDNKDEYNITLQAQYYSDSVGILGTSKSGVAPFDPQPVLIVSNSVANRLAVGDSVVGVGIPTGTLVTGKTSLAGGGGGSVVAEWRINLNKTPNQTDISLLGGSVGWGQAGGGNVIWKTNIRSSKLRNPHITLSYSEKSKGWISFKSFHHENGISLNNSYYTFKGGEMFQHHVNETRNEFYGEPFDSSVDVLFNKVPGIIKSFSTLNYEGSQAKVTPEINNNPDYYDNFPKDGWYVKEMISNAQELGEMEFWDKEDKWFSQIKGVATEWLNDGTAGNIDPQEFSYQGIGNAYSVYCPTCPTVFTYDCVGGVCVGLAGPGGEFATEFDCLNCTGCRCNQPVVSFNCINDSCIDPGDGSGIYNTYCDCVMLIPASQSTSSVESAPPQYCCNEGEAYLYTCQNTSPPSQLTYGCMDDGTTTDPFITQQRPSGWVGQATNYYAGVNVHDCSCIYANSTPTWDCFVSPFLGGTCYDPGTGLGQYSTLSDCEAGCVITPTWNCSYSPGSGYTQLECWDDGFGNGTYTSLSACQSNCAQASWDCMDSGAGFGCYDPGTGNGQYATLSACESDPHSPCCTPTLDMDQMCTYNFNQWSATGYNVYSATATYYPGLYVSFVDPANGIVNYFVASAASGGILGSSFANQQLYPPPTAANTSVVGGTGIWEGCSVIPCSQPIPGCTDIWAQNYNPLATIDDGSCIYINDPYGCTNPLASNYDPTAIIDDGSCEFVVESWDCVALFGGGSGSCLDPGDGTGQYSSLSACETNCCTPTLIMDSGCQSIYDTWTAGTFGPAPNHVYSSTQLYYPNQTVSYIDPAVGIVNYFIATPASGGNFTPNASAANPQLYPPPTAANLWSATNYNGYWEGCEVDPCNDPPVGCLFCTGASGYVEGCCDDTAVNYDPLATCNDGSCIAYIYGCTDPLALNYYAGASIDDGSCIYPGGTSWDCVGGNCVDPGTGNGQYATLALCYDNQCEISGKVNSGMVFDFVSQLSLMEEWVRTSIPHQTLEDYTFERTDAAYQSGYCPGPNGGYYGFIYSVAASIGGSASPTFYVYNDFIVWANANANIGTNGCTGFSLAMDTTQINLELCKCFGGNPGVSNGCSNYVFAPWQSSMCGCYGCGS